jgi:hypothetical protein
MQLEQCKSVLHVPVASGCGLQNVNTLGFVGSVWFGSSSSPKVVWFLVTLCIWSLQVGEFSIAMLGQRL